MSSFAASPWSFELGPRENSSMGKDGMGRRSPRDPHRINSAGMVTVPWPDMILSVYTSTPIIGVARRLARLASHLTHIAYCLTRQLTRTSVLYLH